MSIYASAAMSGMNALHLLGGGQNAGTIGAYNASYQAEASRMAARDAKNLAEGNIAAINQDKILTNIQIEMRQQEAEAHAMVSAAAAGVSGSSIDSVIYGTEATASMQRAQAKAKADQLTDQQLTNVANATAQEQSVAKVETSSTFGNLMQAASSFEMGDLDIAESLSSGEGVLSNLWSG